MLQSQFLHMKYMYLVQAAVCKDLHHPSPEQDWEQISHDQDYPIESQMVDTKLPQEMPVASVFALSQLVYLNKHKIYTYYSYFACEREFN